MVDQEKIKKHVKEILKEIGEDIEREGIQATPTRVARMYENVFYGYTKKLVVMDEKTRNKKLDKNIIPITAFKNENKEMLIRKVNFISHCEHHIVPFFGVAHIGIIPNKILLGMNKIDKIVKFFAARLQIQERMTQQIANWIWKNIKPLGVIVIIKARHMCAELQGDDGHFITSAVKGRFYKTPIGKTPKAEFLSLINLDEEK
ncbi:MAG: GTP cyclohydrolase I [Candidatus Heimdallarchaeaceae archaeon]